MTIEISGDDAGHEERVEEDPEIGRRSQQGHVVLEAGLRLQHAAHQAASAPV